jgi:hypothetical protein
MAINREGGGGHRGERMALELKKFVRRIWGSSSDLKRRLTQIQPVVGRGLVRVWHRVYIWCYKLRLFVVRHGAFANCIAFIVAIGASILAIPVLEHLLETHFTSEAGLSMLRALLVTLGGALIGATAIAFSIVMFAVQINFARMPHGLFRRLSSDFRLLGAFALTFGLAIVVASLSLVPNASWSAVALLTAIWSTILILILFLSGYRRALDLINPVVQLRLIMTSAQKDMRRWARSARRMAPLLKRPNEDKQADPPRSTHDMPRMAYFQVNPHWTAVSRQAITHAISFARRYADQGDYEVSERALNAVVVINASYVEAKGKTFFAHNPVFDIPQATDGFINETLEHLRQTAHVATTRGDEEQIRQTLAAMASLVQVYMHIDYASEYVESKEHAQLAASYLTGAVERVVPRNMADVVMEGVRLMGRSAQLFLAASNPKDIVTLTEKIAAISCTGVVKQEFRPVTLTGMEQLARLTFNLIRTKGHDIHFAVKELRGDVELVVQMFLNVPDAPPTNTHSTFLAPYYSLTKTQTLGGWLTELVNALVQADADNKDAAAVIRNLEAWAEELYRTEKKLLLLAVEKRSHFTFDVIHWIAHVTKLLLAVSEAPATDDHTKGELQRHAHWLISVLSWIPDDKDTISFVENFGLTELLFEVALDAQSRGGHDVAESTRELLVSWAFKGGRHHTGWAILERSILALIILVLWKEDADLVPWLRTELAKGLRGQEAPDQELRDRAARGLREKAETLYRRELELSRINHAMGQIDPAKLRPLLHEIANLLSPGTAGEPVDLGFY